ncbi:ATPase domain-containing protein [Geitlerinema sp. CS-897]|nr:ATPase domain-containing protein [Geitlerinema sp. CS-897]
MSEPRLSIGIPGLDRILHGGLIPGGAYLVRGGPGCGKTTLGLHFLLAGQADGDRPLYITLGESEVQIRRNGGLMGFDLSGIEFLDLSPRPEFFTEFQTYDIFSTAEVERDPIARSIVERIEAFQPRRVFVDSMTQFRYLASDGFQFRKQVLSFLRFLQERGATVLFVSESSSEFPDNDLQFMSDGIINLEFQGRERFVSIQKFRGSDFHRGSHTLKLKANCGIEVYPRLVSGNYSQEFVSESIPSGIPEIDELLHGGIERGTVTIVTGPSGVGKTTLASQFMKEAAGRGERSVVYLFDEAEETFLNRCESINIPVLAMKQRGTLSVVSIEPLIVSPDEFTEIVRREVEQLSAQIVTIDSISGYRLSIPSGDLVRRLHVLCQYLRNMGVTVILVNETEAITGDFRATEIGISYIADNIIFLKYIEIEHEIRKAIGILKKRMGDFEKILREFQVTRYGIKVGNPLRHLHGLLSGEISKAKRKTRKTSFPQNSTES